MGFVAEDDADYDKTLSSTSNYSRSGWCDFCESFFRFRDRHIRSKKHQTNRPLETFQKLDKLISACGTLDDFVQRGVDEKKNQIVVADLTGTQSFRGRKRKTLSVCFEDEIHLSSVELPRKRANKMGSCFEEDNLQLSDFHACQKEQKEDMDTSVIDTSVVDISVVETSVVDTSVVDQSFNTSVNII